MKKYYHSVELIPDKCIGCTDCIKRCPTEAIRVRNGKAKIIDERCIDCGMCIGVCRNHAKRSTTHALNVIKDFKYKIAIPAPTLYGQFKKTSNVNVILTALKKLGFDDVYEVAAAAEWVSERTKEFMKKNTEIRPYISSACPVTLRLISMRFPSLIENILPILSPMEVAAISAKNLAVEKGIPREDIGVFFISPCASKVTYINNPIGLNKSEVDGVIAIQDIYLPLRTAMASLDETEPLMTSTYEGMGWALSGGESNNTHFKNAISVDGLDNVIKILEQVENGTINDVDFIEALACTAGCVGGSLTVVNPYIAKNFIGRAMKSAAETPSYMKRNITIPDGTVNCFFDVGIEKLSVMQLDDDMETAIQKLEDISDIYADLPMIDCGSCGAPTCHALAEDIVCNDAHIEDCVFMLRQKVRDLAESMVDLSSKIPQTISDKSKRD